jgi:hypothetical protein
MPSGDLAPQDSDHQAVSGLPAVVVDPEPRVHQANAVESAFYEGFKTVVEGLYDCSDMFLPLKTVAGGILKIIKVVEVRILVYNNTDSRVIHTWFLVDQTASGNKKELEDLKAKLEVILSIVKKYREQEHNGSRALSYRIEMFCTSVAFSCPFLPFYIDQCFAVLSLSN